MDDPAVPDLDPEPGPPEPAEPSAARLKLRVAAPALAAGSEPGPGAAPAAGTRRLIALIGGFIALYGALVVLKYRYFLYRDFDLAIFTQSLERALAGSTVTSIRGMSWLGDHASYVLYLLLPLYAIVRHPLLLPVVQTVVLGLGAIPVFRMTLASRSGRAHRDGSETRALVALTMAAAYLLQPALGYLDLFEFHPEALGTTALLFGLEASMAGRWRACLAWHALALLTREDVALVVMAIGVLSLAIDRPARPTGAVLILVAGASLFVTFAVIRPRFGTAGADYLSMYGGLGDGPLAIASNATRHPFEVLEKLVTTPGNLLDSRLKGEFYLHLLLPLGFLPLLAPLALLAAVPVTAEHLLSTRVQQHTIVFQYTALILPVLAWAAVLGLRRFRSEKAARRAALVALAGALAGQACFGPVGWGVLQTSRSTERVLPDAGDRALAATRSAMLSRVPARGAVVASFEFLPRLARRDSVHSLHHVLRGAYTYSSRAYPELENVTAVLADWGDPMIRRYAADPRARERVARLLERNALAPALAAGSLVLYSRAAAGSPPPRLNAGSASPSPRRGPPP